MSVTGKRSLSWAKVKLGMPGHRVFDYIGVLVGMSDYLLYNASEYKTV